MKLKSVAKIFKALNNENVRYLVAGGLAVVAHGYLRFTADIDIILDMKKENLELAMNVFKSLGYRPRAPVEIEEFSDYEKRDKWKREKDLKVFSIWNPRHPATEVDLFIEEPIPFDDAYKRSELFELQKGVDVTIIGLDDLITIKKKAGRKRDLEDISKLNALKKDKNND